MIVRIVKDWPYPESFFSQTPNEDGVWGDVRFTEDPIAECDYLIVLQRPPYDIDVKCAEGNAWLITQEPPVGYFRFFTKAFKYFDRVYSYYDVAHPNIRSLQPVLPWHLLKSYHQLSSLTREQLSAKKNEVAWITSSKSGFPGQTARMEFREYLQAQQFQFHLYGRGFTPIHDKFDGLFPCKYALAIENYSTENYWTEKLADSLLSWCLPFYWGAPNLEEYFSPECFIRIDISKPAEALRIINDAIKNGEWERRLAAIEKARHQILNEYQFFPYVAKMIKNDNAFGSKKKKDYKIPVNPYPWYYKWRNQIKYYTRRLLNIR